MVLPALAKGNHIQINAALKLASSKPGTVVLLSEPKVYEIADSLLFYSGAILEGVKGAVIKLAPGLPVWGGRDSSISEKKAMLMIGGRSATGVTIRNLIVDGSQSDYYPDVRLGTSCYNMATIVNCNGLTIQNVTFQNGCNDAMLISSSGNIVIDAATVNKCGHDGVYAYHVNGITVKNSKFINRTNSSVRFDTVSNGNMLDCNCSTSGGGFCGLELQGNLKNVTAKGNYIRGLPYPGIVSLGATMSNVVIEDNTIEKCKSPGINAPGAILRNNVIR